MTEDTNITADRIVLELAKLDVSVVRFDLADFPHHLALDATLRNSRWSGTLSARGRTVALEDIQAVLWWHPGKPQIAADGLSAGQAEWVRKEAAAGLIGVLAALDCFQFAHPPSTLAAQLKADALARAALCGVRVPQTWIGNSRIPAREFVTGSPSGAVCKSLVSPSLVEGPYSSSFYTSRVEAGQIDGSIAGGAHQLQHAVEKAYEVRLVVVGRDMFAAGIHAHSAAARTDFRSDYPALSYSRVEVPGSVREGITRILDHYGLVYAAIDLIVDPDDQWWLLDLNPAGNYDWLQKELPELAISAAIARLLAGTPPAARRRSPRPAQPNTKEASSADLGSR
ncbi:MvdC/MvdD family ATP grasp protein [Streptomyces sp. NPDC091280]|uniref:MvdC/MvdD family ATP grasp protein n=1 Tax=Streptomyces sp. NPDC091280 TaxID=3365984 RepID=UPI003812BB87